MTVRLVIHLNLPLWTEVDFELRYQHFSLSLQNSFNYIKYTNYVASLIDVDLVHTHKPVSLSIELKIEQKKYARFN